MRKKNLSILLAACLIFSLLPVSAMAAPTAGGTCGDDLTWTLENRVLTISGTGPMTNYSSHNPSGVTIGYSTAPWSGYGISWVRIEDGVTSIGAYAFAGTDLSSLTIGKDVKSIESYAFYRCRSLSVVDIPDNVTSIGRNVFENCTGLRSVKLPDTLTNIGTDVFKKTQFHDELCEDAANWENGMLYLGNYLMEAESGITTADIRPGTTLIAGGAFRDCESLTSAAIPDGVTGIGESAFGGCSSLVSVAIPDSVTSIGWYSFSGCSSLKSVIIPKGVTSIGPGTFERCSSLTNVTLPDSLTEIRGFSHCSSLTSIDIPDGVTSLGGFNDCTGLTSVTIPGSVERIAGGAFWDCSSLKSVTAPNGVNVNIIGANAFNGCSALTDIAILDWVTTIGDDAFRDCTALTDVTALDYITTIGNNAFRGCSSLTGVTIPSFADSIGEYAFEDCGMLKDIAFTGTKGDWASITKGTKAVPSSIRIHYNCTSLDGHLIAMERKEPACNSNGYIKYGCNCGYEFTETLTQDHDYVLVKSVATTCKYVGYDEYKCSRCGNVKKEYYDEKLLAHDYKLTKAVEPTCTEHGYDVYTCAACGTSKTETRNDELLPHDYVVTVVEPTCLKGGYTLHKCSVCGDEYKDNLTALLGHSMVEVSEKPATCTEAGHTAGVQCSRCGAIESGVTEIPALDHSYGAWKQTKAPTCTAKGTETRTCTRCNATQTRDVNALGHSYGAWTQTKAPTCTAKGTETQSCTRCNAAQTRDVNALGHSYANGKCTRCGAADPNYKPAPKAPELKITTSAGKPKIYWNAVDGAVKYWIYRSTDGKNFKYYDSTTKTSYTNNSTAIGSTYYYKVKSVGANGAKSDYSVSKGILCKPAAPTVSISRSNGKPKLSWKTVSGATKYWIYRSTDGVNFKYFDSTTKTSYTNSGAASGTKYYYRVKAVAVVNGKNVVSANSSTKSLFTSLAKPSVSITTSNGKPKLTWKAVTGADKYYIYRSTDGKNFSYFDSTTKTTYVNSGAKKNTKYYYKVKAVCASNSNANSAQSSAVSIKATK